jgi:hypothetical protein
LPCALKSSQKAAALGVAGTALLMPRGLVWLVRRLFSQRCAHSPLLRCRTLPSLMPASTGYGNWRSSVSSRAFTCVFRHSPHPLPALASHLSLCIAVRQRQLLCILRSSCLSTAAYLDATLKPAHPSSAPLDMPTLRQVFISPLTCCPPIAYFMLFRCC